MKEKSILDERTEGSAGPQGAEVQIFGRSGKEHIDSQVDFTRAMHHARYDAMRVDPSVDGGLHRIRSEKVEAAHPAYTSTIPMFTDATSRFAAQAKTRDQRESVRPRGRRADDGQGNARQRETEGRGGNIRSAGLGARIRPGAPDLGARAGVPAAAIEGPKKFHDT